MVIEVRLVAGSRSGDGCWLGRDMGERSGVVWVVIAGYIRIKYASG